MHHSLSASDLRKFCASFNCPLCHKMMEDPTLLPCGHSFCRSCVFPIVDDLKKGRKCPCCGLPCNNPALRRCPLLATLCSAMSDLVQLVLASEGAAALSPLPSQPERCSPASPPPASDPPPKKRPRMSLKFSPEVLQEEEVFLTSESWMKLRRAVADPPGHLDVSLASLRTMSPEASQLDSKFSELQEIDNTLQSHQAALRAAGIHLDLSCSPIMTVDPGTPKPPPAASSPAEGALKPMEHDLPHQSPPPSTLSSSDVVVPPQVLVQETPASAPNGTPMASSDPVVVAPAEPSPPPPKLPVVSVSGMNYRDRNKVKDQCHELGYLNVDIDQGSTTPIAEHVTHMITMDPAPRTFKYCCALLLGCWVVTKDWLQTCKDKGSPQPEAQFEVAGDSAPGFLRSGGPMLGRLARAARDRGDATFMCEGKEYKASLLADRKVALHDITLTSRSALQRFVELAGAEVVPMDAEPDVIIIDRTAVPATEGVVVLTLRGLLRGVATWKIDGV